MRKKKSCDSLRTTTTFLRTLTKKKFSQLGVEDIMTEFFMAMIPPTTTHQEPTELKQARAKLEAHLAKHMSNKYTCGIRLTTKWLFPVKGKHANGEYRTTKPDTDNLQKLLKDCMTKVGFWKDDALVASEIVEKFWSDVPGIYIKIEELD